MPAGTPTRPAHDALWKLDLAQGDLLVVLGGPIGAEEDALYPYLTGEVRRIRGRIDSGRPLGSRPSLCRCGVLRLDRWIPLS